jgi:chondroitin 4-sulfotransferase 11
MTPSMNVEPERRRVSRWRDRLGHLRRRAISSLYPLSAHLPLGPYEQPELWVSEALKVCYVVNPKVASSSILAALSQMATGQAIEAFWHNHPLVSPFRRTSVRQVPAGYFRFTVVRDPLDRIVSLYRQKFLRAPMDEEPFAYARYLGGLFSPSDDFPAFCAKVAKIPDRLAERHFISQGFWFDRICQVPLDYVGRFETIEQDWATICRRIGRRVDLPRINVSTLVPFNPPVPDLVRDRYAGDLERFGY